MQHYLMLSRENFMPKNSIVTEFCHLALVGPVIMPYRIDCSINSKYQKSNTSN